MNKDTIMQLTGISERQYELSRIPHQYRQTSPYHGCSICGFGPGAAQHSTENPAFEILLDEPHRREK